MCSPGPIGRAPTSSALDNADDRLALLTSQVDALEADLCAKAGALSAARSLAADGFAVAVGAELAELAMPHARLQVDLSRADDAGGLDLDGRRVAFGPYGVDEVEITLAAHPGAAFRPLAKGASGGELSRVMLGIEVVLAGQDPVPTFVFDEVDAGVGGRAAVEIGRRLARLARDAQVLVVTHLPQVAAFADQHLLVSKSDDGSVTSSDVRRLEGQDRVRELSRMLAGLDDLAAGAGPRRGAAGHGCPGQAGRVRVPVPRRHRPVPAARGDRHRTAGPPYQEPHQAASAPVTSR